MNMTDADKICITALLCIFMVCATTLGVVQTFTKSQDQNVQLAFQLEQLQIKCAQRNFR